MKGGYMSFVKVMVHSVWGTKNRQPLMRKEIKEKIISHIKENAKSKGIFIDEINGYLEHLHCIFGMNADLSISKTMQLIKGESAHWINLEGLIIEKFEWADEYFAVSVSESMLNKVREYIRNQEEHHREKTFKEEYDEFINKYNFGIHG
jgi:REP element-mobilizing transposase RayT